MRSAMVLLAAREDWAWAGFLASMLSQNLGALGTHKDEQFEERFEKC